MANFLYLMALLLGVVMLTPEIFAQGFIDSPCDPFSSEPQCRGMLGMSHLACVPMYNTFANGTCRCQPGTFYHPQLFECRVGAGSACRLGDSSAPICTPNAQCTTADNICQCNSGYYVPSIGSFRVTGLGSPCGDSTTTNAQCDITKHLVCGGSDPANLVCVCSGSDVWSAERNKCLATVGTTSACSVHDDCVENSVCTINNFGIARCRCGPGFSQDDQNKCSLSIGASCDPGPNAALKCNTVERLACSTTNNTCACAEGRVEQAGVCRGYAGHSCNTNADCAANSFLLCHDFMKTCFCSQREETIQLQDGTCARLGRNGYCRPGQYDCSSLEYLVCNHITGTEYGRCGCQSGYQMDVNGRCRRPLGAACSPGTMNHNCVENAACIRDRCECLPNHAPTSDGRCLRLAGEPCNIGATNQCHTGLGLICAFGVNTCGCPTGQEWDASRQHCVALVSGNCTQASNYCISYATCNERGICECSPGYSQYTTYDRRCLATYGTPCDPSNTTMPVCNDQDYLHCDTESGTCACEFSSQQVWDAPLGTCLSLVGAHCGTYLGEHMNRRMQCVQSALCLQDTNHVTKCLCSERDDMEPDGTGRCKPIVKDDEDDDDDADADDGATSIFGGATLLTVATVFSCTQFYV